MHVIWTLSREEETAGRSSEEGPIYTNAALSQEAAGSTWNAFM